MSGLNPAGEKDMNFADLSQSQKGVFAFRVVVGFCSLLGTGLMTIILSYVMSANAQLEQQSKDIAQIKWEIPAMKATTAADKVELIRQIANLEDRIRDNRNLDEEDRKELNRLSLEIAVIQQKLKMP